MRTLVVFEDKDTSDFAQLLSVAYAGRPADFIFAGSNTLVLPEAEKHVNDYDLIYMYIDFPPGNAEINRVCQKIATVLVHSDDLRTKLILVPTLGMEFYILRAFEHVIMLPNCEEDIMHLIEMVASPYAYCYNKKAAWLSCLTYERFCKQVMRTFVLACAAITVPTEHMKLKHMFYTSDCPCGLQTDSAKYSLYEKSIMLLKQLPVIPSGVYFDGIVDDSRPNAIKMYKRQLAVLDSLYLDQLKTCPKYSWRQQLVQPSCIFPYDLYD